MRAVVVDAYDSFVHTIVQYLERLDIDVVVFKNDQVTTEKIREENSDFILLGPGPGHPANVGYIEIVGEFKSEIPIMGICLGHQAIGLAFGGRVAKAAHIMHGKTSEINHDGQGCFKEQPQPFAATRYHSLIVEKESVSSGDLIVSATSQDDDYVMGMRHKEFPIESVQFHPESVLTESGLNLFRNFVSTYVNKTVGV